MSKPDELMLAEEAHYSAADVYRSCLAAKSRWTYGGEWLRVQDATAMPRQHQRIFDMSERSTQLRSEHCCKG